MSPRSNSADPKPTSISLPRVTVTVEWNRTKSTREVLFGVSYHVCALAFGPREPWKVGTYELMACNQRIEDCQDIINRYNFPFHLHIDEDGLNIQAPWGWFDFIAVFKYCRNRYFETEEFSGDDVYIYKNSGTIVIAPALEFRHTPDSVLIIVEGVEEMLEALKKRPAQN